MIRPVWIPCALALGLAACSGPRRAPEPPPQERLLLEVTGNEAFSAANLEEVARAEIARSGPGAPAKSAVDDAAFAVELFYRNRGFSFVQVDYEFEQGEQGVRASLMISEGVRTKLDGVTLTGNESFDAKTLMSLFDLDDEGYLVESEVRNGAAAIANFYRARGYLQAEVSKPDIRFEDGDRRAAVTIVIVEGPVFVLREVALEGGLAELAEEEQRLVGEVLGRTYLPRVAQELRARLLELYARNARPDCFVEVLADLDRESGDVKLAGRIEPGERVTIVGIQVIGNEETSDLRILSRIPMEPGDAYDERKIREAFSELYSLALFDSVRIDLTPGPGGERELVIEVVEAPSLEFYIEPGWGSYEGPRVRFGVEEINVFGTGFRVNLDSSLSVRAQGTRFSVTDPRFLDSKVSAETSVFWNRREEPSFTASEVGFGLDFRRIWTRHFTTAAGYSLRSTKLDDADLGALVPPELLEDVDIGAIVFSMLFDSRDALLAPTDGHRAQLQFEWGSELFASQLDFVKGTAVATRVQSLGEHTVLVGTAGTSVIVPTEDTDVIPLQARLYNGGENSVRSFKENELGPKDASGEPVGGEVKNLLSLELRRQLVGNLSGAFFVDTGNVELFHEEYFRFNDVRAGVGIGVRYLLPIGPLRLDWGVNPNPRDGEEEWVLHFAVGWPY